jgi:phospholipid transport system substrate-binding protein
VNPRWLVPLAASLFVLYGTAFASTAEAERRLQTAVNEVLRIANRAPNNSALAESLHPVLLKYMSFDAMTRRAIGPGWRQFTPDQQRKAIQLFTTLVIRKYSSKFTLGENPLVKFKTASVPAPGRVEVPTTLLYQGTKYNVTYRLEEAEGWRITDVVVEGVSFVANYRAQFDAQFKKGGTNEILSALSQSVARPQ